MSTSAYFNKDAEDALVKGANLVGNAVKQTLGPGGKTVVIQNKDKPLQITKDGVTVAKSISPKDEKVKLGADLVISVARKQVSAVGDGTTTATVIAQELVNNGIRQVSLTDTINRTSLRKGIEKARDYVISELDKMSIEVKTPENLVDVATISANGDEKLGKVVASAYEKVGKEGVVLVEETKDRDITLDFKEGMTFEKGWVSQYFVTNHDAQTVEFDNPAIILCNSKISNFGTLASILQGTIESRPVVIIAESFDSSVTQALAMNIIRTGGQIKAALVEAPGYGDARLNRLRDMAIYLGAKVADDPIGVSLDAMSSADFGSCEKIIIKQDETIIRGGKGDKDEIKERIDAIEGMKKTLPENDTFTREQLSKRLAALSTGIAIIRVGGSSEEEIKELRDRLDDAQFSVKSALEEGYVPGAGNTLLLLSEKIKREVKSDNESEQLGINILANALKAPFRTILTNAGVSYDFIEKDILVTNKIEHGYNAKTLKITNLLEDGVLDAVKAVKGAVYAASSIASVILTSSVIVTEDPLPENTGLSLNMMPGMM